MREIVQIAAISAVFGLLLLFAGPAAAAGNTNLPAPCGGDMGNRMSTRLDRLEGLGYDLTSIETAIANSDFQAAHTMMQEFMQEHRDDLPASPPRDMGTRMSASLDRLEGLGYDLSTVRTAIENNDFATAHSLTQEFIQEHRDELPAPPLEERPGFGGHKAGSGWTV